MTIFTDVSRVSRFLLLPLVLLVALFAFAGCEAEVSVGKKTVSKAELEKGTLKALAQIDAEQAKTVDVSCPEEVEAKKGATTECELRPDDSDDVYAIAVKMKDDKGNFSIEVADEPKA